MLSTFTNVDNIQRHKSNYNTFKIMKFIKSYSRTMKKLKLDNSNRKITGKTPNASN